MTDRLLARNRLAKISLFAYHRSVCEELSRYRTYCLLIEPPSGRDDSVLGIGYVKDYAL